MTEQQQSVEAALIQAAAEVVGLCVEEDDADTVKRVRDDAARYLSKRFTDATMPRAPGGT